MYSENGWEIINSAKLRGLQKRNNVLKEKVIELEKQVRLMSFIIKAQAEVMEDYVAKLEERNNAEGVHRAKTMPNTKQE